MTAHLFAAAHAHFAASTPLRQLGHQHRGFKKKKRRAGARAGAQRRRLRAGISNLRAKPGRGRGRLLLRRAALKRRRSIERQNIRTTSAISKWRIFICARRTAGWAKNEYLEKQQTAIWAARSPLYRQRSCLILVQTSGGGVRDALQAAARTVMRGGVDVPSSPARSVAWADVAAGVRIAAAFLCCCFRFGSAARLPLSCRQEPRTGSSTLARLLKNTHIGAKNQANESALDIGVARRVANGQLHRARQTQRQQAACCGARHQRKHQPAAS